MNAPLLKWSGHIHRKALAAALLGTWISIFAPAALAQAMYSFTSFGDTAGEGDFVSGIFVTTKNTGIIIDRIGIYDLGGDGLAEPHGFRVYDSTHSIDLINTVIAAGTGALIDGFRYLDVPNIYVAAGTRLAILSDNRSEPNLDLMAHNLSDLAFHSAFTDVSAAFTNGATVDTMPTTPSSIYAGPNILITSAIPEPSTYALMLVGLGMIAVVARRRNSSRA